MVLHHLRSVVIAVRGTETPEDLIIDGLGRECPLSVVDLDGLIKLVSLSLSTPSFLCGHVRLCMHMWVHVHGSICVCRIYIHRFPQMPMHMVAVLLIICYPV